jgi:hydrogenase maturation protease
MPRGGEPGTLYVIEPKLDDAGAKPSAPIEGHNLDPVRVLALVSALGGQVRRLLVVGCEPTPNGEDEFQDGLSPPVAAAVEEAADLVESLIARLAADDAGSQRSTIPVTEAPSWQPKLPTA